MIQKTLALIIIVFFLVRLVIQKNKKQLSNNEFVLWLLFWSLAALAIIFIGWIDIFVSNLGFTGTGIDVLLYLGVAVSFYLIFRMRIKLEKIDRDITKIVREISLKEKK